MADEFPDPDEEFELMHAAEMEMLHEMEMETVEEDFYESQNAGPKAKRSLDFKNYEGNDPKNLPSSPEEEPLQNNSFLIQNDTGQCSSSSQHTKSKNMSKSKQENAQDFVNTENLFEALNDNASTSNKRRVEDLFGDIDDIYFDDDHTSKKSKNEELTEEEKQLMTIETILMERKRLQESKILPRSTNLNSRISKSKKVTFSRTVPRYNFMALTDKKGERIYTRLYSEEEHDKQIKEMTNQNLSGGLLSVPFHELQKLAEEQLQKKWDRIEKAQQEEQNRTEVEIVREQDKELWVEKYKPKSYLELLSDESTNRALLQWLKLWDKVVFGIERKVKVKHKDEMKHKGGKFQRRTGPVVSEELDEYGRPIHKIALLCGPPGLGKTTLAHMIAHQAGYNVVEVNASDDRSPEVFRTQLEAATQMKAVMGADRRPNCLVLDEIDGAPAASIDVLLKFALGKGAARGRGGKAKKAGGKEGADVLKRPIICICNDVYVPALRPLRQAAFVVHFPPTATARLAQRLCEIARQQHLKTDLGTMMALSEKTNNDIRACLALLQCLKTQASEGREATVKLSQIHAATLGEKDMQKGLFTVWQEIFQIPRPKRKTFVDTVSRDGPKAALDLDSSERKVTTSTLSERVHSVLRTVQGCGDYDRLAQGVFENYLNMKIKDSTMVSVSSGLTWFCMFDLVSTRIHTSQNYILYPYLAYPFVIWHLLFASLSWPKLTYPSTGYEMSMRLQKCNQVVDEVLKCMAPAVRAHTCREQLVQDTLPLLLEIIVPNLRPVSLTLYNSKERAEMSHVISVMIDYNLTYTQERTPDGSFQFSLDPNVEEVSRFEGGKGRSLSYAVRQLVSREIELEKLRRAEASLYRDLYRDNQNNATEEFRPVADSPAVKNSPREASTPKAAAKKSLPNHLQRLTPKAVKKPEDLQTKDFFGRVVENSLVANQQKARTDEIVKSDIWYHFKEGFNNAVRRNITMADLY